MAHTVTIPGFPTFHVPDLRQRADTLALRGNAADAALLHALLDAYLAHTADAAEARDQRAELRECESTAEEAEKRADCAEDNYETLRRAAVEANEALLSALGSLQRGRPDDARGNITEAISELAAALADVKE